MSLPGYAGKMLRVDLTRGTVEAEALSPEVLRDCLGGAGLGIKLLYDEVPPGTRWSDPENRLIIASGPLGGTTVPGSGTFSVACKGTLTNGATSTQANGFCGAYLRLSGFDAIVIQGQAPRLNYLLIEDGRAELRDASHLAGKDTWETVDALSKELGNEGDLSVASIGPAGESLVKFAGIFADKGHAAAHNGAGAVMGSKRLKAIAVRAGRQGIPLYDGKRLAALCQKMLEGTVNDPSAATGLFSWGTLPLFGRFAKGQMYLPVKNYTTNVYPIDPQKLERYSPGSIRKAFAARPTPCFACPMHHSHLLTLPEGPYKGRKVDEPEYEGIAAWGSVTGQTDVVWTIYLADLADRLGMDTNEAGWTMGLAMECYEKGLITREDTDDLELTWGNGPATEAMLRRIALRQGFGDTLAEGAKRAAQKIGGEAPSFAIHGLKGNTPRGHDHRNAWGEMLDTSVSSTGTLEVRALFLPESKGLKLGDASYPQETARLVAGAAGEDYFHDSVGACRFATRGDFPLVLEMVRAATGWDVSDAEGKDIGRRVMNHFRAFNLRHGIGPELDRPSPRYGAASTDSPLKGRSALDSWDEMLRLYYTELGWDAKTGKPLPETLAHLGLKDLIPDLWPKGRGGKRA